MPKDSEKKIKTKFTIDLFATDLHMDEIRIFKDEKRGYKDRQWTKDSEIFGEEIENLCLTYSRENVRKAVKEIFGTDLTIEIDNIVSSELQREKLIKNFEN